MYFSKDYSSGDTYLDCFVNHEIIIFSYSSCYTLCFHYQGCALRVPRARQENDKYSELARMVCVHLLRCFGAALSVVGKVNL